MSERELTEHDVNIILRDRVEYLNRELGFSAHKIENLMKLLRKAADRNAELKAEAIAAQRAADTALHEARKVNRRLQLDLTERGRELGRIRRASDAAG